MQSNAFHASGPCKQHMVSDITVVKRMLARFSGTTIAAVLITDSLRIVVAAQYLPNVESPQCAAMRRILR
jgi:hypothetical protein